MDRSRVKLWLRLSLLFNACIFAALIFRPNTVSELQTALGGQKELIIGREGSQVEWSASEKRCGMCDADPKLCELIGGNSVARSVSYSGSNNRLRRALGKMQRGEPFNVAVIGGSVSRGHGLPTYPQQYAPTNMHRIVFDHLDSLFPSSGEALIDESGKEKGLNGLISGAQGGMGTAYFSHCWREHIPENVDLVLIELGINDELLMKNQETYELLLRGLLELPSKPAVINMQVFALMFGAIAMGGDLHSGFNEYYDVPSLSVRNALLPTILANSSTVKEWFINTNTKDEINNKGGVDLRHLGVAGHKLMGDIVNAYIDTQLCEMDKAESRTGETDVDVLYPIDELPRLRLLQKYDPDTIEGSLHPTCLSTNSEKNPLVPVEQKGWRKWNWEKKNYIIATEPGSKVSFNFYTTIGQVQLFYLRSKVFGLGNVDCWVDDDTSRKERIRGYWDQDINIGQSSTIRTDLKPGTHKLNCELLEDTADPGGGHEFRIISVLSI